MQLNRKKIQILETVRIHYSLEPLPVTQRLQEIQDLTVQFKVDTGSQVNILPQAVCSKLSPKPPLTKPNPKKETSGTL